MTAPCKCCGAQVPEEMFGFAPGKVMLKRQLAALTSTRHRESIFLCSTIITSGEGGPRSSSRCSAVTSACSTTLTSFHRGIRNHKRPDGVDSRIHNIYSLENSCMNDLANVYHALFTETHPLGVDTTSLHSNLASAGRNAPDRITKALDRVSTRGVVSWPALGMLSTHEYPRLRKYRPSLV